ncbi:Rrf2 family transcriptional regulator [Undibacterium sp. TJN25]|uniref:Rrf2 family transcriptional regulator n=1 Tax=Undibacterium sp. TJN25 TaxID=3413056 RepID=UPI003BF22537
MNTSHRFAVGVHIMTLLASTEGLLPSSMIAGSVNTNPAMIRRILGMLNKAGLTTASMGSTGGAMLARPAAQVSLLEIYRAVDEPGVLALHANMPNPDCEVGRCITGVLKGVIAKAENAMEAVIAGISVEDVLKDVLKSG